MQGLVTVFGGSGFVGAQIVQALAKSGARVRVAVRNPGRGYRLRMLGNVGQIEVVQANIRNQDSIDRALEGAESCVNAVAILQETGRQTFEALHVAGARSIAAAAASQGVRAFVQISALGASPESPAAYGRSKAAGEAAVREILPKAILIRPSIIFGPDDSFFSRFARMATLSPILPLIGGGHTRFQPVYVGDVAKAVANSLFNPVAAGGTFELGGPEIYSFRALMALMLDIIQRHRPLVPISYPIADLIGRFGDLAAMLGLPAPLTRDQVALLRIDNVAPPEALGLTELGVTPSAMTSILPSYLYVYRPGGQYAERFLGEPNPTAI